MYEFLASLAQTWGLLLFVFAFVLVLIYTLNPKNKEQFKNAGLIPLDDGPEDTGNEDNV